MSRHEILCIHLNNMKYYDMSYYDKTGDIMYSSCIHHTKERYSVHVHKTSKTFVEMPLKRDLIEQKQSVTDPSVGQK